MKKINGHEALELLKKDVITNEDDINKYANRWLLHCIYVGLSAKRIATKLGCDADYAYSLGIVHDIGRKISHSHHVIEGYKYLIEHGYASSAAICLTHSFIDNDINLVAGGVPTKSETTDFINSFLKLKELTIYDNIIQLCDLFCLETGYTTLEKRLLDIYRRKGIDTNSESHISAAFNLKNRLETSMNTNLYDLFPEIKEEDISNVANDHQQLMSLLSEKEMILTKK